MTASRSVVGTILDRLLRERTVPEDLAEDTADGEVRVDRLGAAPEDDGVARLEAEGGRIGGDVRTGFIDDADHPERDPHPADGQAVRPPPQGGDRSHRIGQRGNLGETSGNPPDAGLGKREAVNHGRGEAGLAGSG